MVLHSTTTFFAICYFEQVLSKSYLYKGSFILNYRYIMKKEIKNFNPFFMQSSYVKTYKFRVNQECTKGLLTMSTYYSVPETNILSLLLYIKKKILLITETVEKVLNDKSWRLWICRCAAQNYICSVKYAINLLFSRSCCLNQCHRFQRVNNTFFVKLNVIPKLAQIVFSEFFL